MLIVEGADYAGKTTLLEVAQKELRRRRWSRRYGLSLLDTQRWGVLADDFDYGPSYLQATHGPQLCDRFVLSELAYGSAFRAGPNPLFTSHRRRLVARELNRAGSVQLYVYADWKSTERRMKLRGDAFVKQRENWAALVKAYGEALVNDLALGVSGVCTLRLDRSDDRTLAGLREDLDHALGCWREHLDRASAIRQLAPESWGYPYARVVFVGERVGGDGTAQRPFCGLEEHGCSAVLSRLMDEADIPEKAVYLLNSFDRSGQRVKREVFEALLPTVVVALGKIASNTMRSLGIEHVEFPHPQWVRRFQCKKTAKWAEELRAAVAPAFSSSSLASSKA